MVAHAVARARLRGRPGFAAALAAGFAASVLGAVVVDGTPAPVRPADALGSAAAPSDVLADRASSDLGTSVQGALERLGTLMTEPPPAPVETREPRVVRVAQDDSPDGPPAPARPSRRAEPPPVRHETPSEERPDRTADDDRPAGADDDAGHGVLGLVRGILSGLL